MKYCEYKNLKLGKDKVAEVTEEEINNEIAALLKQSIKYEVKNTPAEKGDIVNFDFVGYVDGKPFDGGAAEKYDLELGSNSFIPGFEDQLLNSKANQEVDVKVVFPTDYHAENLKGKEAVFKCKIHEVKVKKEPTLNDKFAKEKGFKDVGELRDYCRNLLHKKHEGEMINAYITKIFNHLADNSEIELDLEKVNQRIDEIIKYYEQSIAQYGLTLESYLKMSNLTLDGFKENLRQEAEKSLRIDAVYQHVVDEEKITVTEEEFNMYLETIKNYYNFTEEQMNQLKNERLDQLKEELLREKTSQFLFINNN